MATHHINPERRTLHGHFSRDLTPILTIEPGDTVVYRTLDASWYTESPQLSKPNTPTVKFEPRDPAVDSGHALCGPIAINGAEPGMVLEVAIGSIVPGDFGWTFAGGWPHENNVRLGLTDGYAALDWQIDADMMIATDQKGHRVALRPFMGVMGMPTNEPGILPTAPPRVTGGNIDCKELRSGTRLFLPIQVTGGLFSTGDGHARQGDGESSVIAIECPMEHVELTFRLHPEMRIKTPRAWTPEGWLTLGFHEDLNEATFLALDAMLDVILEEYPETSNRTEALALASVVVDLRVTQIANGVKGVHAVLPHDALRGA